MATISNPYPLGRGLNASSRLYMQHWMWKRQLGYLMHPNIPIEKDASVRIADVGCGTGIWVIDLAKEMPNAVLHGFDIFPAQFPNKRWLPQNVSLSQLDAYAELPVDLVGAYDIVHAGIVVLLVKDGDPRRLLSQMIRMLKPGGFLQWNELDVDNIPRIAPSMETPRTNCDLLYSKIYEVVRSMGVDVDVAWVKNLGRTIESYPILQLITSDYYDVPDDLAQPASQAHLTSIFEIVDRMPGSMVKDNKLRELCEAAAGEVQEGLSIRPGHVVVVGCKVS